jgi:hypothetical protein
MEMRDLIWYLDLVPNPLYLSGRSVAGLTVSMVLATEHDAYFRVMPLKNDRYMPT